MKTLILPIVLFFVSLGVFAQQEIDIVNNTGTNINIFLIVNGTDPNCTNCDDALVTEEFSISPGLTTIDSFVYFNSNSIQLYEGPNNVWALAMEL